MGGTMLKVKTLLWAFVYFILSIFLLVTLLAISIRINEHGYKMFCQTNHYRDLFFLSLSVWLYQKGCFTFWIHLSPEYSWFTSASGQARWSLSPSPAQRTWSRNPISGRRRIRLDATQASDLKDSKEELSFLIWRTLSSPQPASLSTRPIPSSL